MSDEQPVQAQQPLSKEDRYKDRANEFSIRGNSKIENGVIEDRKCTDIFMLVLFVAFLCAMGGITGFCIING